MTCALRPARSGRQEGPRPWHSVARRRVGDGHGLNQGLTSSRGRAGAARRARGDRDRDELHSDALSSETAEERDGLARDRIRLLWKKSVTRVGNHH